MKIALIIAQLDCGGAERVITLMANYFSSNGHQVSLFTFSQRGKQPFFPVDKEVCLVDLDISMKGHSFYSAIIMSIRGVKKLRHAIKKCAPDVVISFIDITNILSICSSFGLKIPVIVSERTDPSQWEIGVRWNLLRRLTYPFATGIVVQTQRARNYFKGRAFRRCRVIPNPVCEVIDKQPLADSPRNNRKVIVSLGRLIPSKGFDLLIDAFMKLEKDFPEWDVHIYGEGPFREALQQMICAAGAEERILLNGKTSEPMRILQASNLFVFPSRFEGFPNALCEAMAVGLPVISFDCPSGPREILRDGIDGILVNEISVAALECAMRRMLSDSEFRSACSKSAPDILNRFGIDYVMSQWTSLAEEVSRKK